MLGEDLGNSEEYNTWEAMELQEDFSSHMTLENEVGIQTLSKWMCLSKNSRISSDRLEMAGPGSKG